MTVVRVELVEYGRKESFANLVLPVVPKVDEWITRVAGDWPAYWAEPFDGIRCYQVRVRRFLSNGRIRLVVQRGVNYEDLMREEFSEK